MEEKETVREAMALNLLKMMLILLCLLQSPSAIAKVVPQLVLPGCMEKCGNVTIPYPFGNRYGCFMDPHYNITCEAQEDGSFKTYRGNDHVGEVVEISLMEAQVTLKANYSSSDCFNATGERTVIAYKYNLSDIPYTFSAKKNKLIAIGCDTLAYLTDSWDENYTSGCMSQCGSMDNVTNGTCFGIGCCQASIPPGLKSFYVNLESKYNHTRNHMFNPCSFALFGDPTHFSFDSTVLSARSYDRSKTPVVLDWAIGNQTCQEANSQVCGPNSYCSDSTNGHGYRCFCKNGFHGNPYLPEVGCIDIDECEDEDTNSCAKNAKCHNTDGSYTCECQKGYYGDGQHNGTRCTQDLSRIRVTKIIASTSASCLVLSLFIWFLYWIIQRRRKLREKFFLQNGGILLKQQIASKKGVKHMAKIFSINVLKKATSNFHESRIIGQGGFGTVYKGILSCGKVVAIKKSKIMDKGQIIQFINEVDILSQINHRHVVKLLGCCLETEVPLLVYEFISNGTLFQHIHCNNQASSLSWENRLRIASETADALAYLHSSHSVPIIHRDVKSSNILLDDNYRAKVSDFGASRLVPLDQTLKTTGIQGTYGYLDPECYPTGQLSDKSDVYSFGVVLLELLTGRKALFFEESGDCSTLVTYFLSSMKDENLFQIVDARIISNEKREQILGVAELARDCVRDNREERPTMKEVAKELDSLKMMYEQPSMQRNLETQPFLGEAWTCSIDTALELEMGYSLTDDDLSMVAR